MKVYIFKICSCIPCFPWTTAFSQGNSELIQMRTFIAIELPTHIKQHLGDIVRQLRRSDVHAGWVKPDNLHLTLKFLGDVDESLLPQIVEQIDQVAKQQTAFRADLNEFGFFPSRNRPRILYAAFEDPLPLMQLLQHLDRLLKPLGIAPEQRFHPHITLARIKDSKKTKELQRMTDDIALRQTFTVYAISLFNSTLHSDGARYQRLHRSLLREPGI